MRSTPRGKQTCDDPNPNTHQSGKGQNAKVRRNFVDPRNAWEKSFERIDAPDRNQESSETAQRTQQHTFGNQLLDNLPAARAESGPNTDFAIARKRSGQQQVR